MEKPRPAWVTEAELPNPIDKWQLREQAEGLFQELGYESIGFDHYALPNDKLARAARTGRLRRNFMGFTTQRDGALIGLGCSAISEIDGAFAQNHKTVEGYVEAVQANQFAHDAGHSPSGRDREVARLIRQLLCQGHTELPTFDLGYTVPVLERLGSSLREGLIRIDGLRVELTEQGKLLARHVALAFDEHYWAAPAQRQMFSSGV